nr:muscle M-line assembly protein unc-89-like [Drosophila suzukii]
MALHKIDGVANISKQLNRWRSVAIFMCRQSRNAHVAQHPLTTDKEVPTETTKKVTESLVWSKNSPVSLLVESGRKPQHNRTLELKKAAAQLSRSNESLKAHYIKKRNDRVAEELLAKEPQTAQKLANLMSLNIAMVETKRPRSYSAPPRRMETDHSTGSIDFKPQSNQSVRWKCKKISKEANSFDEAGLKDAKDRQKAPLKNAQKLAEQSQVAEQPQQKASEVDTKPRKTDKIVRTVNKLKIGSITNSSSEDKPDWQKSLHKPTEAPKEPIPKNLNSLAKWKIGSRSIPRLDI